MKFELPLFSVFCLCAFIVIEPTPYFFLMLCSVILHELGHVAAIKFTGLRILKITVLPFGIDIKREKKLLPYRKELLISVSGPFVNLALFAILHKCYPFFSYFNLLYGVFNLLPVSGLDGGEAFIQTLYSLTTVEKAEKAAGVISFIFCILLWTFGIYIFFILNGNMSIFALAVFLFISEIMKKNR